MEQGLETQAADARNAMVGVLAEATRAALAFEYDATLKLASGGIAADGSSDSGGWQLKSADSRASIDDLDQLKACLAAKFKALLPPGSSNAHIATLTGSAALLNGMLNKYTQTGPADNPKPSGTMYKHVVGGSERESKEVLSGKASETKDAVAAPVTGTAAAAKTRALLVGLVDSTQGLGDKEVTLGVKGVHAERALPTHPSLDALKKDGKIAENTDAVFEKARTLAQRAMPPEEIQLFVDKSVRGVITSFLGNRDPGFDLTKEPFTSYLKPAELKAAMVDAISAKKLGEAYTLTTPEAEAEQRAILGKELDSLLTRELFPQFVVADTNWGDANSKKFHVVSADLATGEPKFFHQDESTGMLTPEDDDFLDAAWTTMTSKA